MSTTPQKHRTVSFHDLSDISPGDVIVVLTGHAGDRFPPQRHRDETDQPARPPQYVFVGEVQETNNWQPDTDIEQLGPESTTAAASQTQASIAVAPTLLWQLHDGDLTDVSDRLLTVRQVDQAGTITSDSPPPCYVRYDRGHAPRLVVPENQASDGYLSLVSRSLGWVLDADYGESVDPSQLLPADRELLPSE